MLHMLQCLVCARGQWYDWHVTYIHQTETRQANDIMATARTHHIDIYIYLGLGFCKPARGTKAILHATWGHGAAQGIALPILQSIYTYFLR